MPDTAYSQASANLSSNEPAPDNSQPSDNKQGLRMISVGIIATGTMMGIIGLTASSGKIYVLGMALLLLLIGVKILTTTLNKK
ncbi:MAG: hypothetical protein HC830_11645 [Bacteroidetes bacterium]|nr:hypothetical protein [Bacteroidota bacterium]